MISFTLSQVRASVAGSLARYFQKLLTSSSLRVALMSSNTARTCGEADAVEMGWGMGWLLGRVTVWWGAPRFPHPPPRRGGGGGGGRGLLMRVGLPPPGLPRKRGRGA